MVHGKKRIPYWIDWRLPGLAGPEYHAVISFGLPIEPEDSQYGEYRVKSAGTLSQTRRRNALLAATSQGLSCSGASCWQCSAG